MPSRTRLLSCPPLLCPRCHGPCSVPSGQTASMTSTMSDTLITSTLLSCFGRFCAVALRGMAPSSVVSSFVTPVALVPSVMSRALGGKSPPSSLDSAMMTTAACVAGQRARPGPQSTRLVASSAGCVHSGVYLGPTDHPKYRPNLPERRGEGGVALKDNHRVGRRLNSGHVCGRLEAVEEDSCRRELTRRQISFGDCRVRTRSLVC